MFPRNEIPGFGGGVGGGIGEGGAQQRFAEGEVEGY